MTGNGQHVPHGFHSITPHLKVRGVAKAIEFYKQAFGAREIGRMPGPDGASVMHAEVRIGDSIVMMCDEYPQWGCLSPLALGNTPVTLHLYVPDADASARGGRRGEGDDAGRRHVLGRPLR